MQSDGTEDIEHINQKTSQRIKFQKEQKGEKRKASWDKMNAQSESRPRNADERVAAKETEEKVTRVFPVPRMSTSQAPTTTPKSLQKRLAQQFGHKRVPRRKVTTTTSQQPVLKKPTMMWLSQGPVLYYLRRQ